METAMEGLGFRVYLEGHGDLVSRLKMGIAGVVMWPP